MRLEIVTIGTELVLGYTLDSNGADIARTLAAAGGEVVRRTSVADRPEQIRAAVSEALERTGFVVTTGGLGPTADDVTKRVVAEIFGRPLVVDPAVLSAIEARYVHLGRLPMPPSTRVQAEVPEGASVLANSQGTAPGLWLDDESGRTAVLLPGVPREMRALLREQVLPRLEHLTAGSGGPGGRRQGGVIRSRSVRTTGVSESALAERVGAIEAALAPLTLAYLPSAAGVDWRVTAWGLEAAEADRALARAAARLAAAAGADYYGDDEADLAGVVLELLVRRGYRVAMAESCTGGLVGARLTAVPGASAAFVGGVVAYADTVKTALLGVPAALIRTHGAVSEPVVRAMAEGAAQRFATECSIALTGVAGPSGGTAEKPVGTVWLAAWVRGETRTQRRVFPGDRDEIRRRAAQAALDLLRRALQAA